MIVFRRILTSLFARPLGSARAATKGLLAFVGVIRDALGHEDELFLVPVVVVNVGAVEAVDDGGGVVEGLGRLEDGEGDEGAAARVGEASRVDGPVGNAGLTGVEGQDSAILAAHMRDADADPRLRRPRATSFIACTVSASACITVGSPEPNCVTVAASIISFSPLSDCG